MTVYRNLVRCVFCEYVPYSCDYEKLREYSDIALNQLGDREKEILALRFGLDGKGSRTLEESGKMFNIGRERARQIEEKALRKLRHPARTKELREYLEELEEK